MSDTGMFWILTSEEEQTITILYSDPSDWREDRDRLKRQYPMQFENIRFTTDESSRSIEMHFPHREIYQMVRAAIEADAAAGAYLS